MEATVDIAWRMFRILNERYFCGVLRLDEFDVEEMDTELGFCIEEGGRYIIGLTEWFDCEQQFISTLFHEMVHLYQYQKLGRIPDHDYTFFAWEAIARITGLDFGVCG